MGDFTVCLHRLDLAEMESCKLWMLPCIQIMDTRPNSDGW